MKIAGIVGSPEVDYTVMFKHAWAEIVPTASPDYIPDFIRDGAGSREKVGEGQTTLIQPRGFTASQ